MKYNQLGRTGLYVSEICLGTMTFGGSVEDSVPWKAMGALQQAETDAIVGRALERGVNFLDTADTYSLGECERLVGQALKNLGVARKDVVIATKVYGVVGPGPNDRGASRGHIMDSIHGSLERLQTDHVDLYQLHGDDPVTPVDEILRAMDDLIRQGLVRYVGVSNWQAWKIARALGVCEQRGYAKPATLQAYYSIAGRDIERETTAMLGAEGVGLLVWSPLAGGFLSGKYSPGGDGAATARRATFDFPPLDLDRAHACVAAMREIGARHGASPARVALAWTLARPFVTSIIIGARNLAQLDDNLAAADLELSPQDLARLDEVSALPPEYPGWLSGRQNPRIPPPFKA